MKNVNKGALAIAILKKSSSLYKVIQFKSNEIILETKNPCNVTWHFDLPSDYVQDSESMKVLINADLMGPTIQVRKIKTTIKISI